MPAEFQCQTFNGSASDNVVAAKPDHAGNRDRRKNFDRGIVDGVGHDRVLERVHMTTVDVRELVVGFALAVEELQYDHAADVFLKKGVDARNRGANTPVGVADLVAENLGRVNDQRQHRDGDRRQLPVHAQHDADDSGEYEQVFKDRNHAGGEHFVQLVDLGGDARDQAPHRDLIVQTDAHALQPAYDLA